VHSVHGYFLLTGDVSRPIIYDVDPIRDGGSFTTRRVVAKQGRRAIFHLSASFQTLEEGFEHQDPMPTVLPPESVATDEEVAQAYAKRIPAALRHDVFARRAFELRPIEPASDPISPDPRPPRRDVWMKGRGPIEGSPAIHAALLAYVSDYFLLGTTLLPHGVTWFTAGMQVASLDHTMWFHAPFRTDEWLLHAMDSPRASRGRGLARGSVFSADGRLVASVAQEGLIRLRPGATKGRQPAGSK
jgi:acyl-CoA thioesterase-2